ncbi:MAG: GHKL domain-containing protein [Bdellovibrionaceae bacterium]|nr:GHKL domain-containing protein [Pseudobdellovibrionaceae bacterium]
MDLKSSDVALNLNLKSRVRAVLVGEHYERSLPSSIAIFFLSFIVMSYQYGSLVLGGPMLILGVCLALVTAFRGVISYLGLKGKISTFANEKYLKAALTINSVFWGLVFCLDTWYTDINGVEKLIALSLMFGLTSVAPVALITTPIIQGFFFVVCLIFPAGIYVYRIFDGSLAIQMLAIPGFLSILFLYQLSTSRKLLKMMVRGIENTLRLQIEQENLKTTLAELRMTQGELSSERAKSLNSERLAFLGSMASGVAHEINNPLTISGGQVFKIQNYLSKNPLLDSSKIIGTSVDKIAEMNVRIRNIVRGLQYFARERKVEAPEIFSLNELMDFSAIFFNEKMKTNGIQFEFETPPIVLIKGQKNELSQALFNIVDNAIEAVHGIVDSQVSLKFVRVGETINILIEDNGRGIEKNVQGQIFDPFYTTKDVGQGTGLGLSVARGIVVAHGGEIQCASIPGKTVFTVSLPVAKAKAELEAA